MHTAGLETEVYDHVIIEAGTLPNDEAFYALKDHSLNQGAMDLDAMAAGRYATNITVKGMCFIVLVMLWAVVISLRHA